METPDKWVILKIGKDNPSYKVFATWYGGYLGSDSWKMNSGIVRVEEDETYYKFYGYSGSCYKCNKKTYGTNMYTQGILNGFLEKVNKIEEILSVVTEDTDFMNIKFK